MTAVRILTWTPRSAKERRLEIGPATCVVLMEFSSFDDHAHFKPEPPAFMVVAPGGGNMRQPSGLVGRWFAN